MYIAGRTQMIDQMSYEKAVKTFLDMGFEGVELNNIFRDFSVRPDLFEASRRREIKKGLKDSRLKGFSIGSHMDYVFKKECYDYVVKSMDVANELGTEIVIINGVKAEGRENEWEIMAEKTAGLCDEAEKRGIKLCKEFEPKFICHSTAQLLDLMNEINSPALYANLDLGHVFLEDDEPLAMIKKIGARIAHCHIENMATGIHNHLPFFEGDMNLPAYIETLKKTDFNGQLSFDYYNDNYMIHAPRCIEIFNSWMIS